MTAAERVRDAAKVIETAQKVLRDDVKEAIREELYVVFATHRDIDTVGWGHRATEYNDVGMYEGVAGPWANVVVDLADLRESLEWVYDYAKADPRLKSLNDVLDALGAEVLADIFGDQSAVVAIREPDSNTFTTIVEEMAI